MRSILLSPKFLLPTFVISTIYVIFVTYLMNLSLVGNTLVGSFSLNYKVSIMLDLLEGMWTAMSRSGLVILFITAILTGANLTLLWQRIKLIKGFGKVHLVVGGNSILALVGTGCAACGLPVLSLFGLTGGVLYLPLRGTELSYLALVLLFISFFFLLSSNEKMTCEVN